ncbi:MAG: hypothetical protein ACK53L_21145 [Pirellulaceae bacterium]
MSWLRTIAAFACLAAVAYLGWQVSSWRAQAGRADALSVELRAQKMARATAEVERDASRAEVIALRLDAQEAARATSTKREVRRVIQYVPKTVACDLPDEPVGVLNRARAGMPAAD